MGINKFACRPGVPAARSLLIPHSSQVLVNCVTSNHSHGCHGGDTSAAFAYMAAAAGVPDESCQNYEAIGDGKECTPLNICRTCAPKKGA